MTNFTKIDFNAWKRKEVFTHFTQQIPCSFSLTTELDIKKLLLLCQKKQLSFYPVFVWNLSCAFQTVTEFRYAYNENRELGYYDVMHPCSAFLNKKTELFGSVWTPHCDSLNSFLTAYQKDVQDYCPPASLMPKKPVPNMFHISNIPFFSFTGFSLHLPSSDYFTPIFTLGKINGPNQTVPLAVQAHHAVCDAYHVGKFLDCLQKNLNRTEY